MISFADMDTGTDTSSFFREFYPRVYQFVWRATGGPPDEVEDLVQEVLLHAWRDRDGFRGQSSPLTWVLSIAQNRVRDSRRSGDRRQRAYDGVKALRRMDAEVLPPDALRSGEVRARVWSALDRIGPEAADLIRKKYLRGRSVREIAEEAGESEKAIESRLFRAKEAFRKALHEGVEDEARSL